jgi:uncharacterized peroxidase-related enzyme
MWHTIIVSAAENPTEKDFTMPRIAPVTAPEPDSPVAATFAQVKATVGKVPKAFATIAQSPAAASGYLAFSSALQQGRLTARQRETLALAISQVNECQYCLSVHTVTGKMAGLTPDEIRQARAAQIKDPLENAIVAFAIKAMQQRGMVSDEELRAAREAGVDDGLLIEITANIALMTVTNYANRLADTEIDFPVVQTQL